MIEHDKTKTAVVFTTLCKSLCILLLYYYTVYILYCVD